MIGSEHVGSGHFETETSVYLAGRVSEIMFDLDIYVYHNHPSR